jgi:hypothetical protein
MREVMLELKFETCQRRLEIGGIENCRTGRSLAAMKKFYMSY